MSLDQYRAALSEQYQGEVFGEVLASRMLQQFTSARQQYLLASLLQIETETKARLRPAVARLGISLVETDESRSAAIELFAAMEDLDWIAAMALLAQVLAAPVESYREMAEIAPPEYRDLADSMVVHEWSVHRFAELEASGEGDHSIDEIVKQLVFPLPKPESE